MPTQYIPNPLGVVELLSPSGVVGRHLVKRVLEVEALAKELCPVDTGRLRSSIRHKIEASPSGLVGYVGTDVEYALFVHEGTSRMKGRPFLTKALHRTDGVGRVA